MIMKIDFHHLQFAGLTARAYRLIAPMLTIGRKGEEALMMIVWGAF